MSWHPRDQEAQMLAGMLRSSRLTLLTGVAGAGKTCLLREGVLPRLARRMDDPPGPPTADDVPDAFLAGVSAQGEPADDPRVAAVLADAAGAWSERRQYGGTDIEPGTREVALYMDSWAEGAPLTEFRRRLYLAFGRALPAPAQGGEPPPQLREEIEMLCREQDTRLLVVLDAFEGFLRVPPADPAAAEFAREWALAVNQPGLPAHFLVSVRQEAQALLARFHHELPALASNWIGLLPVPAAPVPSASPDPASLAEAPDEGPGPAHALDAPEAAASEPAPAAAPAMPRAQGIEPLGPLVPYAARRPRRLPAALALAALIGAGLAWWWASVQTPPSPASPALPSSQAPAGAGPIAAPEPLANTSERPPTSPAVAPPAPVAWSIQTGPGQRTDRQVADELQRSLVSRLPPGDWPALQIVHYDALEAARNLPGPPWRVIGPLFPEELQLIVRADAPFSYIHQIRGRRIGTTPSSDGGASGTAALLHQRLFGQLPAEGQVQAAPWPQALADLQAGRTDVLLLADGEPSAWLSELSAQERRGLRLLALDPAAPQTRLVQQSFLPVRMLVPEGLGGGSGPQTPAGRTLLTLAVMSFLTTTAPPEADAAVLGLVRAWCQAMPELRRTGHPKWRAAQPWLPLGVGGPPIPGVREALNRCAPTLPARPQPTPP